MISAFKNAESLHITGNPWQIAHRLPLHQDVIMNERGIVDTALVFLGD